MDFETARFNMVEQQIRPWEVLDPDVLDACLSVERENFVPQQFRNLAFSDTSIDLGHGQSMMLPKVEARLVQSLAIEPADRILEVGTGSGYLTALLGTLGAHVMSVDIETEFVDTAGAKLSRAEIDNVKLLVGDGLDGWTAAAPYDVIAVTGSSPLRRPKIETQLSGGGRMFIVVGLEPVMEALLITRTGANQWTTESLFETTLTPLIGAEPSPTFKF